MTRYPIIHHLKDFMGLESKWRERNALPVCNIRS
jgi:hypothetical protein